MGWCPWQRHTIATGGGYQDGKLRIWDALSGTCETIANTNSQVHWKQKGSRRAIIHWVTPNESDCRSVLCDGLKRGDVWSQATVYLSTISPAGPGTLLRSASPPSSQVRVPESKSWTHSATLEQMLCLMININNWIYRDTCHIFATS